MSCLVDATLLLGAAVPAWPGHEACSSLLERLRKGPEVWYLTPRIVNDLCRWGTSSRILTTPWSRYAIRSWVEDLQRSPFLRMLVPTRNHRRVFATVRKEYSWVRGELPRHFQVAVLMREHGVERIYTNDGRFSVFLFLEVVSPLF